MTSSSATLPGSTRHSRQLLAEGVCVVAGLGYLAVANPHDRSTPMPLCPTKLITGLDCPACGGLRMVHDLLHGDLRAVLHDNIFLLLISPVLLYLIYRHARALKGGRRLEVPPWLAFTCGGLAMGWMVLRNLPSWPLKPTTYA